MLELGEVAEEAHREVGKLAAACVERLYVMGEMAETVADGAREGGLPAGAVIVAGDHEEILADLLTAVNPGDFILVKGSRGMRMERVAEGIRRHLPVSRKRGGGLMLYHLLYPLASSIKLFNVFKYLTFRTIYAMITALVVSFIIGPWVIRKLEATAGAAGDQDRRTGIAPEEAGDPDHGGGADPGGHRHPDPAVGRPDQHLYLADPVHYRRLRADRLRR